MFIKRNISMLCAVACMMSAQFSIPVLAAPAAVVAPAINAQQKGAASIQTMSLLWMRSSAEYRALCYQGYNAAMNEIDKTLAAPKVKTPAKPFAIVLDCDETVVDNTRAMALAAVNGNTNYTSMWWRDTVAAGKATAMPGAVEFLQAVDKKGVEIFYVTNRYAPVNLEPTIKSLRAMNFPSVDKKHLLLMTNSGDKQIRFDAIAKDYDVIVYMGDNAGDLPLYTNGKKMAARNAIIDKHKKAFGTKYIVFPNPAYGSWVGAMADKYNKLTPAEKDAVNKTILVKP